jgi:hypothetical protein
MIADILSKEGIEIQKEIMKDVFVSVFCGGNDKDKRFPIKNNHTKNAYRKKRLRKK